MDWFLYDKGLRHERVKHVFVSKVLHIIANSVDKLISVCRFVFTLEYYLHNFPRA